MKCPKCGHQFVVTPNIHVYDGKKSYEPDFKKGAVEKKGSKKR